MITLNEFLTTIKACKQDELYQKLKTSSFKKNLIEILQKEEIICNLPYSNEILKIVEETSEEDLLLLTFAVNGTKEKKSGIEVEFFHPNPIAFAEHHIYWDDYEDHNLYLDEQDKKEPKNFYLKYGDFYCSILNFVSWDKYSTDLTDQISFLEPLCYALHLKKNGMLK